MPELIFNQHRIPAEQYRYGLRPSADVGCGWIATHNALCLLGWHTDIPALIRYYQRLLPLIHGNAGTSFWAPILCFRKWGFPVSVVTDRRRFDLEARAADACILFYRWHRGWKLGAHFVALHHTPDGFLGYNTFRNSTGPDPYGPSLDAFLTRHHYFGCILITIRNPAGSAR